jgi:hypothetical protein
VISHKLAELRILLATRVALVIDALKRPRSVVLLANSQIDFHFWRNISRSSRVTLPGIFRLNEGVHMKHMSTTLLAALTLALFVVLASQPASAHKVAAQWAEVIGWDTNSGSAYSPFVGVRYKVISAGNCHGVDGEVRTLFINIVPLPQTDNEWKLHLAAQRHLAAIKQALSERRRVHLADHSIAQGGEDSCDRASYVVVEQKLQ